MGPDGSEIETMAMLTVAANATASAVHDRMPAILPQTAFDAWLDVRNVRDREVYELLKPAPETLLKVEELLPDINNSRLEGAELQSRAPQRDGSETTRTLL